MPLSLCAFSSSAGSRLLLSFLTSILLLRGSAAQAQQVLVRADVAEDTVTNLTGPNRRYFGHVYLGYGLMAGASGGPGTTGSYGLRSAEYQVGVRLKRRLSQAFALNLDLRYAYQRFGLEQNSQKTLPSPVIHQAEYFSLHHAQAETSLRLNVGRRGNTVGQYLDLLAFGGWVAGTSHTTEDDPAPVVSAAETTETGLPYLRRWTGGVGARLGIDRYALVARRRLSSAISPGYVYSELPRWTVGIEIGLF